MVDLNSFKLDPELSSDGVWFDVNEECLLSEINDEDKEEAEKEHFLVLLGPTGTQEHDAALVSATKALQGGFRANTLTPDIQYKVNVRGAIKGNVIRDWKNGTIDGEEAKFTRKLAIEILSDLDMRPIFRMLIIEANKTQTFRKTTTAETVKNSEVVSSGIKS